jgi:hypothetical protein
MPTAAMQIKVTSPSAMLVMVNQYVDGSFIEISPFRGNQLHGRGHAEKNGVAPMVRA